MKTINILHSFGLAGLVFMAGLSAPAHAAPALDIADRPLYLQGKVPPSFIMGVDNSGSMTFHTLFPGSDGQACWNTTRRSFLDASGQPYISGTCGFHYVMAGPRISGSYYGIPPFDSFGFARSPDFNPSYFNPWVRYEPWVKGDMTQYPAASTSATRIHPDQTETVNLFETRSNELFRILKNMRIPTGVRYRSGTSGSWSIGDNSLWIGGSSDRYIQYHPATFYLKYSSDSDPLPPGYTESQREKVSVISCASNGDDCTMWKYTIKPGDSLQARQNFANWFSFYGNRNRAMIAALTRSLRSVEDMYVGYFRINNRSGNVAMRNMSVPEEKASLYTSILALNATGSTPTLPSVEYMGNQFRRTGSGAPVRLACQVNAGMLFTDGYANVEQTAAEVNMGAPFDPTPANSMAAIASKFYLNSLRPDFLKQDLVPVSPGCSEPGAVNNPKLDCQRFPHMNLHAITLGSVGTLIGNTYGVAADGSVDPDLALDQVIANPPAWPGYQSGNRSTIDDLWHATVNTRGRFINASTPSDITSAMQQILNAVLDRASVSGGTAASGTRREDGFLAYVPHYDTADWTGNLKAHTLTASGALGTVQWDAAALLAARSISDRKVYFVDAGGTVRELTSSGANLPARTLASMDALVAEMCPAEECTRADLINYLRGDHSMEQRNGGPFRDRKSRIGDILGSQPEVLSKASFGYSGLPDEMGGDSYNTFLTGIKSSRTPLVFVGSNNGMLHAFNGQTGEEVYALIPHSVLVDNLKSDGTAELPGRAVFADLADPGSEARPGSGYDHRFFVDGSPRQGDVYIGGSWKTVLAVPMGAGGRSMLVLDVTNGASASTPTVITEASHADLGYAVDRPRIVPLKDKSWRVLFGNGYNSNNNTAYLFSLNLNGGSLNRHPVGSAGDGTADSPNGMASVAAADDNADGLADAIYAGDYKGNIWKIPVSTSGFDSVTQPFFQARDDAGNVQHITGGIDVTMHPSKGQIVYFGTGRYLLNVDRSLLENPPVETFYGVWDQGWSVSGTATAPTATLTRSDLTEQDLLAEFDTAGRTLRKTSKKPVPWGVSSGWYLDLAAGGTASGERFVGVPVVALGQVIFTTFEPNSDSDECAASGTNWLNVVDASTGVGGLQLDGHSDVVSIKLPDGSSGGGPVGTPPVVTTPPNDECDPAVEDCGVPEPDEETGVVSPVGAPQCNNDLGILLADGVLNFAQLTCGRQSWRQVD